MSQTALEIVEFEFFEFKIISENFNFFQKVRILTFDEDKLVQLSFAEFQLSLSFAEPPINRTWAIFFEK